MAEVDEAEILQAGRAGQVLDCADGGGHRRVDADLIRHCCRELKDQIDPRGLRFHGAAVAGCLDLAGMEVPFPLRFHECEFDSPPVAEGAQLFELTLTGCTRLPGLLANGLRVRRDLDLSASHLTGGHRTSASSSQRAVIWLCESDIGGRLICRDTVIRCEGERSIQADRFHYGITVGYGYRPARVLWFLAVLLVLVTSSLAIPAAQSAMRATTAAGTVYTTHGPISADGTASPSQRASTHGSLSDVCGDGQVRCFSPVLYAIDTVIPLVSLDQRSTWYPDPHARGGTFMEWWLNTATLLGWLLSSIFVLSLARLARTT